MARIPRQHYHSVRLTFSGGRILVACACKATVLDRVETEDEANAVFETHKASAIAAYEAASNAVA